MSIYKIGDDSDFCLKSFRFPWFGSLYWQKPRSFVALHILERRKLLAGQLPSKKFKGTEAKPEKIVEEKEKEVEEEKPKR